MAERITLCECFARDGLQHEPVFVETVAKIAAIDAFAAAGFPRIEATSYSHPDRVPAFRDASAVLAGIAHPAGVWFKATCPNPRAVLRARADCDAGHGANEISLLASVTESHTQRNLRTTRVAQWDNIASMVQAAAGKFRMIGVLSVALGCPFEGAVDPGLVVADVERFAALGVMHVSVCDTTGTATPTAVRAVFRRVLAIPDVTPIAHFHDTRGSGLANCMAALEVGCTWFDSAFGGVGGHPTQIEYGGGYTGNVATEDLVNLLEAEGFDTGLDLDAVQAASRLCERVLGRTLESKVARSGYGLLPQRESHHA